jgi:ribosomal protein S7
MNKNFNSIIKRQKSDLIFLNNNNYEKIFLKKKITKNHINKITFKILKYKKQKNILNSFGNLFIFNKFVNLLTKQGKKTVAEKIVEELCFLIVKKTNLNPFLVISTAILYCVPEFEIRTKKLVRGKKKNFKELIVPYFIENPIRSFSLTTKLLINSSLKRLEEKKTVNKLYLEIIDTFLKNNFSESLKLTKTNLSIILQNRANIHYRW